VDSLYSLITRLQPRREGYWDEASWHMAFNAASYYLYRNNDPAYTNEMRGQLREQYVRRGVEILQEGLRWMPESGRLWMQLAEIYNRRSHEHAKAGAAYEMAYKHGAPNYTLHAAGFNYAQALDEESWRKGYAILKAEYDRGRATPGLIEHLKNVESYLNIPREKRIPEAMPVPKVPQKIVGPWK
jgi:hypothetical protein